METIRLEITIDEANTILAALGQQPYLKVAELIQKVQQQGASQLQETSHEEAPNSQNMELVTQAG